MRPTREDVSLPRARNGTLLPDMKRTAFETALVIAVIALFLEVIHYRNAVLEANVDRKRAWKTVVELRQQCEEKGIPAQAQPR